LYPAILGMMVGKRLLYLWMKERKMGSMGVLVLGTEEGEEFVREVERRSGQRLPNCYQCHKCTAGCPISFAMDLGPARVMRLVQLGQEAVLKSNTIWYCASCMTCTTRCPQEVDIARVMDTLRIMSREKGFVADKDVPTFNDVFLGNVRSHGRIFELTLVLWYNLKSLNPFRDVMKGPRMFLKGKIPIFPHWVRDKRSLNRIFEVAKKREEL
jgi:heterodisulfide reductase subunit C